MRLADVQAVERAQQPTQAGRPQAASDAQAVARDPVQAALDARSEAHANAGLRRALDASPRVGQQVSLAASVQRQPTAHPSGLPPALAAGVERLAGVSLADVRVHYNSSEPAAIQARAFTRGAQIHVAPGEEATLPHEAWHAAQQAQGRVTPTLQAQGLPINDDARLEQEADVMGARAERLGATAGAVAAPPLAQPAAAVPAQAPVQGVWVTVRGQAKKVQARTLEVRDGVQLYSHGGKLYVRVSGSASTHDLVVKQVKSQRRSIRDTRPTGRAKEERRARLQEVRKQRRTRRRFEQPQVDTGPRFTALDPVQQEQVLALGRYLSQQAAARFEDDLSASLQRQHGDAYRQIAEALARRKTAPTPPDVSRRDQSNEFDLNIAEANKLFGGSITTTDKDTLIGGISQENAFDDEGVLLPESQYAEAARANRNRVVSGLDNRVSPVLFALPQENRQLGRLLVFAVLHDENGASLFEVFQSASGLLGQGAPGVQIYRALPHDDLASFGWGVYPDWFEGPTLLNYLASALHGGTPRWPAVQVPESIKDLVTTQIQELARAGVVQRDDSGGRVPRVLWDEVSAEERRAITDVHDEESYLELKQRYENEGHPPAFIALVLLRGSDFGDTRTAWHQGLAKALVPPSERVGGLDAPQVKPRSIRTLTDNTNAVADYLGDYDYGTSIGDKRDETLSLIDQDPGGASAINKYIAGGFGSASDTLDQPWSKEGDRSSRVSIQGAVRGLEKLPVREGWSYRREESANEHAPGEIISPGVLWSSALAPQFASQFDRQGEGTLYAIHSRSTARDVQLLAGKLKWYQREVLFPPYARFVVEDKVEDERYGTVYTLRELPPQGTSLERGDVLDELDGRLSEDKELRTLVDKRHFDKALDKYSRQEAWTTQEAEGEHIEGLSGGIHHPRELYGSETFRRWREGLRWQPTPTEQTALWTVDGFLELASRVSGQPERLRDGWSGWGEGDDTFSLSPSSADNATALGLRVGRYYTAREFQSGWKRALSGLPDRGYRDGDFAQVRSGPWSRALTKELNQNGNVWVWRDDVPTLLRVGALKPEGGPSEYTVKYGLGTTRDVRAALERLLGEAQRHLNGLDVFSGDYAERVTRAAARLQQDVVAIHPLSNANGRISRLYMYKVLQKYLPAFGGYDALPVLPDTGKDLTTSRGDWGDQLWNLVRPVI